MEAHHLGAMIEGLQYDWIYHEHRYYYSLLALERHLAAHGLSVFDVEPVELHGGSMRYYICKDLRAPSPSVARLRQQELDLGLRRVETFIEFAVGVWRHAAHLRRVIGAYRDAGQRIAGYGASGRANALMQAGGFAVDYMVDDAPAKHGYCTPGTHVEIRPRDALRSDPPDLVLVFAWTYQDEILPKIEQPVILPLPRIEVLAQRMAA